MKIPENLEIKFWLKQNVSICKNSSDEIRSYNEKCKQTILFTVEAANGQKHFQSKFIVLMWMSIWIIWCNPSSKDEFSNVFTFECRWQNALGVILFAMHWKHVFIYKWNQQTLVIFDYLSCFSLLLFEFSDSQTFSVLKFMWIHIDEERERGRQWQRKENQWIECFEF